MDSTPHIFDTEHIRQRRARAAPRFAAHDFLHRRVALEIVDRLETVTRSFQRAVIFGPGAAHVVETLTPACGVGQVHAARQATAHAGDFVGEEEAAPFAPQSLDLIISSLALHAANDMPGALAQLRRALKPDGLFIGALFGGDTLVELRTAFQLAEAELEGGVSPRIYPYAEIRDLGGLLQRAGFALPVADLDRIDARYETPLDLLRDLRGMGETNALASRRRRFLRRGTFLRAMDIYKERFQTKDGRTPATFNIVFLTGWAPHDSQQKPLAPGSAKTSLEKAVIAKKV